MDEVFQADLSPGESILWSGKPSPKVIFHKEDIFLVPFGLLWGGFAIFWELGVMGFWGDGNAKGATPFNLFMVLWGIPFVLIGQYLIWGRFIYSAWQKKKIFYAVTNKRVLVLHGHRGHHLESAYLDAIPGIDKTVRTDGIGTLRFGSAPRGFGFWGRRGGWGVWDEFASDGVPTFRDIEDVNRVYELVSRLKEQPRESKPRFGFSS